MSVRYHFVEFSESGQVFQPLNGETQTHFVSHVERLHISGAFQTSPGLTTKIQTVYKSAAHQS